MLLVEIRADGAHVGEARAALDVGGHAQGAGADMVGDRVARPPEFGGELVHREPHAVVFVGQQQGGAAKVVHSAALTM